MLPGPGLFDCTEFQSGDLCVFNIFNTFGKRNEYTSTPYTATAFFMYCHRVTRCIYVQCPASLSVRVETPPRELQKTQHHAGPSNKLSILLRVVQRGQGCLRNLHVKESADTLCLSGCFCLTETLAAIKAKTGPPVTPVMVSESGEKKTQETIDLQLLQLWCLKVGKKKPKKPLIIIFPIDMAIKVGCFIDVHRFIISNPPKKTTPASAAQAEAPH